MHEEFDDETIKRFSGLSSRGIIEITGDEILYYVERDHYKNRDFIEYITNLSDEKILNTLTDVLVRLINDTACNTTELIVNEMEKRFMEETYND